MRQEINEENIQYQANIIKKGREIRQEGNVFDSYYNAICFFAHSKSKTLIKMLLDLIEESKYELSETDFSEIRDGIIDAGIEYLELLLQHISDHPLAASSWDYCSRLLSELIEHERLEKGSYIEVSQATFPVIKIALIKFLNINVCEDGVFRYNNYMGTLKECLFSIDLSKYDNNYVADLKNLLWDYLKFYMSQDETGIYFFPPASKENNIDINLVNDTLECMYIVQQGDLINALKELMNKTYGRETIKKYINWFLE